MGDHAVGVSAVPGRHCIGGKTGVHDGNGRLVIFRLKVLIKPAELPHKEHALVDDGPRAQGADVSVLRGLLELAADHIEPSVEVNAFLYFGRPFDEALRDVRHAVDGDLAEDFLVNRDVAPAQDLHAALIGDDLEHAHGKSALQSLLRQEKHSDAVVALSAQLYAGFLRRFLKELV